MSPLYAEVLAFCRAQLAQQTHRPVVIGIQGPQGAGKTTLTRALIDALPALGLTGTTVSIDDFYMTRAGQLEVAAAHPGNPYMEHRGYPGTHDVALGEQTLESLRGCGPVRAGADGCGQVRAGADGCGPVRAGADGCEQVRAGADGCEQVRAGADGCEQVRLPVYDKSAHGGRGDRAPVEQWRTVPTPLDLVFVEGWMLGFTPVSESSLTDPNLVAPNRALAEYDRWYRHIDAWVILRALDPNYVLTWRVEAEERMKATGKPGLSRADIEDYIRRFIPAYETWGGAPTGAAASRCLELRVDLARQML